MDWPRTGGRTNPGDLFDQDYQERNVLYADRQHSSSARPSNRERDDGYRDIVCHLDARRRVISCKDNIQWVVQTKRGGKWRSQGFFRNRDTLIARSGASGDALEILKRLPETHP